jgi:hypothetical protein
MEIDIAPAPFLELTVKDGKPFTDGVVWPLECGDQGLWMFALYAKFGGWEPMQEYVGIDVTVDVEGYNTNPGGHFFSDESSSYYIGHSICTFPDSGILALVPVLPPDTLADLSALEGLEATVHLEIDTGGQPLVFDGSATLEVSALQVENICDG